MSGRISAPGIYEVPEAEYHGTEICAEPSISSTGLRTILSRCPAAYWHASALNPNREPLTTKALDFGKAAHHWCITGDDGFAARFHVLGDDVNLRTKDGKAERDEALAAGKTVLNAKEFAAIRQMQAALRANPMAVDALSAGIIEPTLVWRDRETGAMLRCRPDFLPHGLRFIPDYKTTESARPDDFQRSIWTYGYHMQAAHYLDGIEVVTGTKPAAFFFVAQEKKPPFLVQLIALDSEAVEWGRIQNRKAVRIFADCVAADRWPGYADDIVTTGLPVYAAKELQYQHEAGRFDPTVPTFKDAA